MFFQQQHSELAGHFQQLTAEFGKRFSELEAVPAVLRAEILGLKQENVRFEEKFATVFGQLQTLSQQYGTICKYLQEKDDAPVLPQVVEVLAPQVNEGLWEERFSLFDKKLQNFFTDLGRIEKSLGERIFGLEKLSLNPKMGPPDNLPVLAGQVVSLQKALQAVVSRVKTMDGEGLHFEEQLGVLKEEFSGEMRKIFEEFLRLKAATSAPQKEIVSKERFKRLEYDLEQLSGLPQFCETLEASMQELSCEWDALRAQLNVGNPPGFPVRDTPTPGLGSSQAPLQTGLTAQSSSSSNAMFQQPPPALPSMRKPCRAEHNI